MLCGIIPTAVAGLIAAELIYKTDGILLLYAILLLVGGIIIISLLISICEIADCQIKTLQILQEQKTEEEQE